MHKVQNYRINSRQQKT